jgi:hypothetical protein
MPIDLAIDVEQQLYLVDDLVTSPQQHKDK